MDESALKDLERQLGEAEAQFYGAATRRIKTLSEKIEFSESPEEISTYLNLAEQAFNGLQAGLKRMKGTKKKKGESDAVAIRNNA